MRLLPFRGGDLALDGEGDAIGARNAQARGIAADLNSRQLLATDDMKRNISSSRLTFLE